MVISALRSGRYFVIELATASVWYPQLYGNLVTEPLENEDLASRCVRIDGREYIAAGLSGAVTP